MLALQLCNKKNYSPCNRGRGRVRKSAELQTQSFRREKKKLLSTHEKVSHN